MKAIRNYEGHKGHIAVYLTEEDVQKIIQDYFEDAANEVSEETFDFDFTFGNQDEYDSMVEVYIQPKNPH